MFILKFVADVKILAKKSMFYLKFVANVKILVIRIRKKRISSYVFKVYILRVLKFLLKTSSI